LRRIWKNSATPVGHSRGRGTPRVPRRGRRTRCGSGRSCLGHVDTGAVGPQGLAEGQHERLASLASFACWHQFRPTRFWRGRASCSSYSSGVWRHCGVLAVAGPWRRPAGGRGQSGRDRDRDVAAVRDTRAACDEERHQGFSRCSSRDFGAGVRGAVVRGAGQDRVEAEVGALGRTRRIAHALPRSATSDQRSSRRKATIARRLRAGRLLNDGIGADGLTSADSSVRELRMRPIWVRSLPGPWLPWSPI
jgi:hypothetical protein